MFDSLEHYENIQSFKTLFVCTQYVPILYVYAWRTYFSGKILIKSTHVRSAYLFFERISTPANVRICTYFLAQACTHYVPIFR